MNLSYNLSKRSPIIRPIVILIVKIWVIPGHGWVHDTKYPHFDEKVDILNVWQHEKVDFLICPT